jgi:hypothetical protein
MHPVRLFSTLAAAATLAVALPAAAHAQQGDTTSHIPKGTTVVKKTGKEIKRAGKHTYKAVKKAGKQTEAETHRTGKHIKAEAKRVDKRMTKDSTKS